jgi:hypothetical protein
MPALYRDQLCATERTMLEPTHQLVTSFIMGRDLFDSHVSSLHQKWFLLRVLTVGSNPC